MYLSPAVLRRFIRHTRISFAPRRGSIVCMDNNKFRDNHDPHNRLEWSEILFQVYQQEALRTMKPASTLRTIWRFQIVNNDTQRLIGEAKTLR